jgi:putative phosphoribosyl transferase
MSAFIQENEPFFDRRQAGRLLAKKLTRYAGDPNAIVLGLPRGGVPVAYEIAQALGIRLDVFEVRKLGTPGHEELAMGAIANGGGVYLNQRIIDELAISREQIAVVLARERRELERGERLYRDHRPLPELAGKTIILVDDGVATGASMLAAIAALRQLAPTRVVVAIPVAPTETLADLQVVVDEVVCWAAPEPFYAVGAAYEALSQVSDNDVRALLDLAYQGPFAA